MDVAAESEASTGGHLLATRGGLLPTMDAFLESSNAAPAPVRSLRPLMPGNTEPSKFTAKTLAEEVATEVVAVASDASTSAPQRADEVSRAATDTSSNDTSSSETPDVTEASSRRGVTVAPAMLPTSSTSVVPSRSALLASRQARQRSKASSIPPQKAPSLPHKAVSLWKASSELALNSLASAQLLVSFESVYVIAVFIFSLLLLALFPPCLSSLILLPLHMILLVLVRSWASPSQPSVLVSAYLVGCCIRFGAAIAAAGTRFWMAA